jgi:hypothetical protein
MTSFCLKKSRSVSAPRCVYVRGEVAAWLFFGCSSFGPVRKKRRLPRHRAQSISFVRHYSGSGIPLRVRNPRSEAAGWLHSSSSRSDVDHWWEITRCTDREALAQDVLGLYIRHAVPWFAQQSNLAVMRDQWSTWPKWSEQAAAATQVLAELAE